MHLHRGQHHFAPTKVFLIALNKIITTATNPNNTPNTFKNPPTFCAVSPNEYKTSSLTTQTPS